MNSVIGRRPKTGFYIARLAQNLCYLAMLLGSVNSSLLAQFQLAQPVKYDISAPDAGGPVPLVIADLNQDTRPDVVVAFPSSVLVILNKGDGTFLAPVAYGVPSGNVAGVAVADFNLDGLPDVAILAGPCCFVGGNEYVHILYNKGGGILGNSVDVPVASSTCCGGPLYAADFDGDGSPDLAVMFGPYWAKETKVLRNEGNGNFSVIDDLPAPGPAMYMADLNGDGRPDLYFTYNGITVDLNNGAGMIIPGKTYSIGGLPLYIAADLHENDKPDLIGVDNYSYAAQPYSLIDLPNRGNGTFGQYFEIPECGSNPIAAGDLDGDGRVDVIGYCGDLQNFTFFKNTNGVLANSGHVGSLSHQGSLSLSLADVDGDGKLDLIVVDSYQNPTGASLYVLRNTTPISTGPLSVSAVLPDEGGNAGTVSGVEIVGEGFPADVQVKLIGPGPDISATSLTVSPTGNLINVSFNLSGVLPGVYTLVLADKNGSVLLTKPSAFTVLKGGASDIWVDIVGPSALRGGITQSYFLLVGNRGSVDSGIGVGVWASIPDFVTYSSPASLGPTGTIPGNSDVSLFYQFGTPIPAGKTTITPILLTAPTSFQYAHRPFQLSVWQASH